MTLTTDALKEWIEEMAIAIEQDENPDPGHYTYFIQEPDAALLLVDLIANLEDAQMDDERAYYSACIFALEICVSQLQSAMESSVKRAQKAMDKLMSQLAQAILRKKQTLSFWLPVLNAFYEVHIELSDELKDAYFALASEDEGNIVTEESSYLDSIRALITELSDLSIFDIAENFFAQSYAMPADFFPDLVLDLYHIDEGQEIALLMLLHPKADVRELVVATFDQIIHSITLSSNALTRLQTIKYWYPQTHRVQFDNWIKIQRKKGIVFATEKPNVKLELKASEVDGVGAQGIFMHLHIGRKHRLCGLLFKLGVGIKDAWITPFVSLKEVKRHYHSSFDDNVDLREINLAYLERLTNHFLAVSIEQGHMPDLHLLEIQEAIGLRFIPEKIVLPELMEELAIAITPFTENTIQDALKRSKNWAKNKQFTESWYEENAEIDKIVNRYCSYVEGIKVCEIEEAMAALLDEEMEKNRDHWMFHFLWISLWLEAGARKNEKTWQDAFLIAHAIQSGTPLSNIPIIQEIAYQSIINSVETMHERRTHLNQQ